MRKMIWRAGACTCALVLVATAAGPAGARSSVQAAKAHNARFHSATMAETAGYVAVGGCVASPDGGMGYHYAHFASLDGVVDPLHPELLVYVPTANGGLKLGALEYMVPDADQDLSTDADRPSVHGVPFHGPMLGHEPGMPIHYDLHFWLYEHNSSGLTADWNPAVTCP